MFLAPCVSCCSCGFSGICVLFSRGITYLKMLHFSYTLEKKIYFPSEILDLYFVTVWDLFYSLCFGKQSSRSAVLHGIHGCYSVARAAGTDPGLSV